MEFSDDAVTGEAGRWSLEGATRLVDEKIAAFFAWLGALCARKPKAVLVVSSCVVLFCGVGLCRFSINSNDDTLYLPSKAVSVERNGWEDRDGRPGKRGHRDTFRCQAALAAAGLKRP